jgi:hypothetical protein
VALLLNLQMTFFSSKIWPLKWPESLRHTGDIPPPPPFLLANEWFNVNLIPVPLGALSFVLSPLQQISDIERPMCLSVALVVKLFVV